MSVRSASELSAQHRTREELAGSFTRKRDTEEGLRGGNEREGEERRGEGRRKRRPGRKEEVGGNWGES